MAKDRLQKILAHAGIASRRAAEGMIAQGRVRVNGKVVTELGATADSHKDKIEVDNKRVVLEKPVYYVVHKPRGMVSTLSDPEGRPHLGEMLSKMGARVYPIGRLDFHTSGVLLVTNDGELTEALLHPRKDVPKIYVAKLRGHVAVPELDKLRNGVVLDDGHKTKNADVFVLREEDRCTWVQITLYEGKNRQIHRMGDAIGHPVLRLARTSFAGVTSEGLRPGEWRELDARELEKLKKTYVTPVRKAKDLEALAPKPRGPGAKLRDEDAAPTGRAAPRGTSAARGAGRPGAKPGAKARPSDERRGPAARGDERPRGPASRGGDERPRGPAARGDERSRGPASRGGDERPRGPASRGGDERPRGAKPRPTGERRSAEPRTIAKPASRSRAAESPDERPAKDSTAPARPKIKSRLTSPKRRA